MAVFTTREKKRINRFAAVFRALRMGDRLGKLGTDGKPTEVEPASWKAASAGAPGAPFILQFSMTAAESKTYLVDHGTDSLRVLDVWAVNVGAGTAGDTVQVLNAATPITDAISLNGADKLRVAMGTLDDAAQDVADGAALTITTVEGGSNADCIVNVLGMWV